MSKSSKPKKAEATASEKTNAAVASAEYTYFKEKYDPLLQQMRDQSMTQDTKSTLRGRANADTMQTLTKDLSYQQTQNVQNAGSLATGYQGQLGAANKASKSIDNQAQSNVLGTARGQAADAQSGMAEASRMAAVESLKKAEAKQATSAAKWKAASSLAGSFALQGMANKGSGEGGSFFTPASQKGASAMSRLGWGAQNMLDPGREGGGLTK